MIQHLAPGGDLGFYEALVAMDGGVLKGERMLSGFIMIQPSSEIARQFDLLRISTTPAYVARYAEFEDWFKHTQDIPGGVLPVDCPAPLPGQRARCSDA